MFNMCSLNDMANGKAIIQLAPNITQHGRLDGRECSREMVPQLTQSEID